MQDWVVTGKWSIKEGCSCSKWEVLLKMETLLCSADFSWMNWWSCAQLAPRWQPLTHFIAHLGPAGLVECNDCNGRTVFLVFNCRPLKDGYNVVPEIQDFALCASSGHKILDLWNGSTTDWPARECMMEQWLNAKGTISRYLYFTLVYATLYFYSTNFVLYCATFPDNYSY